jgi:uncharacterized protein YcfL
MKKIIFILSVVSVVLASCGSGEPVTKPVVDSSKVSAVIITKSSVDSVKTAVKTAVKDSTKTK